jgi:DNA-binding response OmpR family regulator
MVGTGTIGTGKLTTGNIGKTTARVLAITQDVEVKKLLNNLMLHNRVQAGVTESTWNATRFLSTNPAPDLVILDLDLPEAHSLEFLQQLRQRSELARLPVLVLTSFPDPTQVRQALDSGANRYLTKMFMAKNLLTTVHEMMD